MAADLDVEVWLRGGWAMDFFLGKVTRNHEDIDWFAQAQNAPSLTAALLECGYQAMPGPPPDLQLNLVKDGEDISFTWLATEATGRVVLAGGPDAGALLPEGMLAWEPGHVGDLRCPIISPLAQIEIKEMMPVWVPSFPHRAKDEQDVARLRAALEARTDAAS